MQLKALAFKFILFIFLLLFAKDLKLFAQAPNDSIYVQSLFDSAGIYSANGNYTKAIEHLQEIVNLKKKSGIDIEPQYFKVFNWLGVNCYEKGQLRKAIDYYELAIKHTSINYNKSIIHGNIANVYSLLGEYSKAISYLENSLVLLEKSNNKKKIEKIIFNYHNQGYAYYQSGQYKLALLKNLTSIKIAEENNYKIQGSTFYNCGLIYQAMDSLKKAECYYKKSLDINIKKFGENNLQTGLSYMYYAINFLNNKEYNKSYKLLNKALLIFKTKLGEKHHYISLCLKHLGNLYFQKQNYSKSLICYQQALMAKIHEFNDTSIYQNPAKDIYPDLDLLDVFNAKAKAFEKLASKENKEKNLEAALQTLQLSVGFIEQLKTGYLYENSKLQLAETEHNVYLNIVGIAYELYQSTENMDFAEIAFQYAELSKYSVLRELQNEDMAKQLADIPQKIIDREYRLKEEIGSLRMQISEESKQGKPDREKQNRLSNQLFKLSLELDNLKQSLDKDYPDYYRSKYNYKTISIQQLKKLIDKKDAVIEFVIGEHELYTFTITKDTFLLINQKLDSIFYKDLYFYKNALHSEHSSSYYKYRDATYNLYKKFIYPFENVLQNKSLIIIPDGQINLIVFETLLDKPYNKNDLPDYRKESYLLKRFPISYAYSATFLNKPLSREHKKNSRILGIAPSYSNSKDSLTDLPLGLSNVRKIALLTFGKALTGEKATKENFFKYHNNYDIIQFYAHGIEDSVNLLYSKLYLSEPDNLESSPYLYAWEINNLKLKSRMIVLASCNSGAGKLLKGEGVMSISRSFMNAGSESVVMSLWSATYIPTITILADFYKNLFKGMRKDKALQLAKIKYLKNIDSIRAHPRYWAGLVITGSNIALYKYWYLKRIIFFLTSIIFILLIIKWKHLIFKLF